MNRLERLAATLSCFGPGPRAGAFVLAAVALEPVALFALDAREVLSLGWGACAFAVCVSYAWWLSVVWIGAGIVHVGRRASGSAATRWAGRFVRGTLAVPATLAAAAFAAGSTSLRLRTGRFVSLDGLRTSFLFPAGGDRNLDAVAAHELRTGLPFLGLTLLVAAAFWVAVAWPGGATAEAAAGTLRRRARRRAWLYAPLLVLASYNVARLQGGDVGGTLARQVVATKLDPLLTLGLSLADGAEEPASRVRGALDPTTLAPIDSAAWAPADPGRADRWVVIVKVESLRADCLGLAPGGVPLTPRLDALARTSRVFTRAYAPSTHTDYSDLAVLASRYPLRTRGKHYPVADERWPQEPIYETLARSGWSSGLFSSADLAWLRMDWELATPRLERFVMSRASHAMNLSDARLDGGLDDARTTDAAIAWLDDVARRGRRACLFLDLQGPHYPYSLPGGAPRPFQPVDERFEGRTIAAYPAERRDAIRNDYFNTVHEADAQIGRVMAALERLGMLERTVLAIFGDHGQMFQEVPGYITHGREPYELAVRAPLLIRAPGALASGRDDEPVELVDLVPTLFGLLGGPRPGGLQGIDLLDPRDRPPAARRLVFLHVQHFTSATDAVVAGGRWKLVHDRLAGRLRLHDLTVDPLEQRDLSAAEAGRRARLEAILGLWRARQLAYHDDPSLHRGLYPPRPPRLDEDP